MIYLFIAIFIIIAAFGFIAIYAIDNFDIDNEVFEIEDEEDDVVIF